MTNRYYSLSGRRGWVAGFLSIAQQVSSPPYQSSANHAQADPKKKTYRCNPRFSQLSSLNSFYGSFRSTVSTARFAQRFARRVPLSGSYNSYAEHLCGYQRVILEFECSDVRIPISPTFVTTKPASGADTLVLSSAEWLFITRLTS